MPQQPSDKKGVHGWKVRYTVTDDIGRVWWCRLFLYEDEALSYAELKDRREGEYFELDTELIEGDWPDELWEAGSYTELVQAWDTELFTEDEKAELGPPPEGNYRILNTGDPDRWFYHVS